VYDTSRDILLFHGEILCAFTRKWNRATAAAAVEDFMRMFRNHYDVAIEVTFFKPVSMSCHDFLSCCEDWSISFGHVYRLGLLDGDIFARFHNAYCDTFEGPESCGWKRTLFIIFITF